MSTVSPALIKQYAVFIVLPDCRLQRCIKGSSRGDGDGLVDAELIYSVYEKHYHVVMYECRPGGVMRAVKRNY